jgi:hypothetical protein
MKKLILILSPILFLFLCSCAIGPLTSHETARTQGQGNYELAGGYGTSGYVLKWNYGIVDHFDVGVQLESLSMGVRIKYAFIEAKEQGFSMAGALGAGSSIGGHHQYGDLTASYLNEKWEPYGAFRYVYVKIDPVDFKDKDTGDVEFSTPSSSYNYGQAFLGTRFWIDPHWYLSGEVSSLMSFTKGLKFGKSVILGLAVGYNF